MDADGGSVAVLQGGEGGLCACAPLGPLGVGLGEESTPPSPPCNTATLAPSFAATGSFPMSCVNAIPLQSVLQHCNTTSRPVIGLTHRRPVFSCRASGPRAGSTSPPSSTRNLPIFRD